MGESETRASNPDRITSALIARFLLMSTFVIYRCFVYRCRLSYIWVFVPSAGPVQVQTGVGPLRPVTAERTG